jgi:5-methylthioadenosine/S-adenosylhomocysteine deaminase
MSAEELLKVATRGGARAAGLADEIGSLEAGKRADLMLVDPSDADAWGAADPLYIAAHCIVGRDVRSVIVDGRLVMKERELLTVDLDRLRASLATRRAEIMARFDAVVTG